jgi:hypothetical protein
MYENGKMRLIETIPGMDGRGNKREKWKELSMIHCKNINALTYPQYNNSFKKEKKTVNLYS